MPSPHLLQPQTADSCLSPLSTFTLLIRPAGFRRFLKLLVQAGCSDWREKKGKQLLSHAGCAPTTVPASYVGSSLVFPIYNLWNEEVVPVAAACGEKRELLSPRHLRPASVDLLKPSPQSSQIMVFLSFLLGVPPKRLQCTRYWVILYLFLTVLLQKTTTGQDGDLPSCKCGLICLLLPSLSLLVSLWSCCSVPFSANLCWRE